MPESEDAYRRALADHHRRSVLTGAFSSVVILPVTLAPRARRSHAARDPWGYASVVLTVISALLSRVSAYRRAEQLADADLARQALARENRERAGRGEAVPLVAVLPRGRTSVGCLASGGFLVAGWTQALLDYARRPDRDRHAAGRWWRLRPGPAWWTAWSFQQLPVNAASTAPRAAQIAYERRQLVTLTGASTATAAVTAWEEHLRPGVAERDGLRVAAAVAAIANAVLRGVADHRLVPVKVDARRARRRRHDAAVAALVAARAAGLPEPRNPWRREMLLVAGSVAAVIPGVVVHIRVHRSRPTPPDDGP